jgi:hypothetical protein
VADNPILKEEITNGHAARMRYSRFKKQMDSSIGIVKKTRKNSPRKPTVDKPKMAKKQQERQKPKVGEVEGQESTTTEKRERPELEDEESEAGGQRVMKREPGERIGGYACGMPYTPQSQYSAPSPGLSHHGFDSLGNEMDDMATSFGLSEADFYEPMMGHGYGSGMGMDMSMGMADAFDPLWQEHEARHLGMKDERQITDEGGVLVKNEPRWEESYKH